MARRFLSRLLNNASHPGKRRPSARPKVKTSRLHIEPLEHRWVLNTFFPSASAADGAINSLRADIIKSNTNNQDDTILLTAGTYKLSITNTAGQENAAQQGDLDILPDNLSGTAHKLTIKG